MRYASLLLVVPFAMSAHAGMLYPKGAKATVTVEYSYQSAGAKAETPSDPIATTWRAKRSVTVTATLAAQPPIGVPTMHKQEDQQKAEVADLQKRSKQLMVQTAPMMDAAMAAFEKCGDNEACLEREAKAMSGVVEQSDVKGARENVAVMSATAASMNDTPRYQRWESVSQAASPYVFDEEKNVRSREPGCMRNAKATCITQETIKGSAALPASNQGLAMFEVDSKSGDLALALPIPLGVFPATFTRTTDDPDLAAESMKTQIVFPSLSSDRAGSLRAPLVVPIKDLRAATGTLTFPAKGELDEAGTLTVKWRIAPL
jgi:hypothetical protein